MIGNQVVQLLYGRCIVIDRHGLIVEARCIIQPHKISYKPLTFL